MLTTSSDKPKDSVVAKLLPPRNVSVAKLVKETDIPRDVICGWRRQDALG